MAAVSEVSAAPGATDSVAIGLKLQEAVQGALPQLGELEPWQKRIFSEEAVPRASRFVRDYRASNAGLVVDVDLPSLRNYLKLHAAKVLKKGEFPKMLIGLKAEAGCPRCLEALPEIRRMMKERAERRGFTPVWASERELRFGGKALAEHLARLAAEQKIPAALVVSWEKAPVDSVDTAHADELRYLVRSMLWVAELPRSEGQLEILANDSLERTADRLVTDFLTELGGKLDGTRLAGTGGKEKLRVEVTGLRNFPAYVELKNRLLAFARDGVAVEEKRVSKGRAVFAVFSEESPEELRKRISGLGLDAMGKVTFIEGENP
ncbi:MAG: hypothetical protein NDJ89_15915 [Oligoflexia bacterium]|nr:hypothetical protein [Oligoflexia bacterium]